MIHALQDILEIVKAQCQEYTNIDSLDCPDGDILIQGRQSGGDNYYTPYSPGLEADYTTPSIYGHDNLCLPKSNICGA